MNVSLLVECQRMMERELAALRTPTEAPQPSLKCPDENELASRLSECAMDELLNARRAARIRELENALRRIEVMDYGMCEECGEPIPLSRLMAAPSVRYCVTCQREREEAARSLTASDAFCSRHPVRPVTYARPVMRCAPFALPRRNRQASR